MRRLPGPGRPPTSGIHQKQGPPPSGGAVLAVLDVARGLDVGVVEHLGGDDARPAAGAAATLPAHTSWRRRVCVMAGRRRRIWSSRWSRAWVR